MNKNIKGLIFDLDGVIAETAKVHYVAWRDEVKKIGIDFSEEENATLKGLPRQETLIGILKIHGKLGEFTNEQLIEMTTKKNERYKKLLETELKEGDWLPGIKKLIDDGKRMNLRLSIASSSHNAPIILKKIGLFDEFDFIVNPSDVTNGKPDAEIFIKACEGINIKPREAIGFEDAIPGVKGLKKANIYSIAITHGDDGEWELANQVYKSTDELELREILRRKNV